MSQSITIKQFHLTGRERTVFLHQTMHYVFHYICDLIKLLMVLMSLIYAALYSKYFINNEELDGGAMSSFRMVLERLSYHNHRMGDQSYKLLLRPRGGWWPFLLLCCIYKERSVPQQ
jgi:hypothetical protein